MKNQRLEYPLELINTCVVFCQDLIKAKKRKTNDQENVFIRTFFPYSLLYCKNDKFLPLNREYKPIGLFGYSNWADYEKYDHLLIDKKDIDFSFLDDPISPLGNKSVFFYNDSSSPRSYKNIVIYKEKLQNVFFNRNSYENKLLLDQRKLYELNID